MKAIDLSGAVVGRLTVVSYSHSQNDRIWKCRCECGNEVFVRANHLRLARIKSCGCLRKDMLSDSKTIHGKRHSPEYYVWAGMVQGCTNTRNKRYAAYGGRGISVCDKWLSFSGFYEDMGCRQKGKTLDRINNDGPYCLENCRWATPEEQSNNKRTSRRLSFRGKTQTIAQWSRELLISPKKLYKLISKNDNQNV